MSSVGSLAWFAHHEFRLSWRDWARMMHATRSIKSIVAIVIFIAVMHLVAYAVVGRFAHLVAELTTLDLVVITASALLTWLLLLSQGIESATRVIYTRSDLDVIMASPVNFAKVVCIRLAAVALTVTLMSTLVAMPFIDVLVWIGGVRWLTAFGVIAAGGLSASAGAIALTMLLFRLVGEARARLIAQIVAAVVGAGFVIGLQIVAVSSFETMSRMTVLTSGAVLKIAPDSDSLLWLPARAIVGDVGAMSGLVAASMLLLLLAIGLLAPQFGVAAGTASSPVAVRTQRHQSFRKTSRQHALLRKELRLLRRDPWLVSQTLMQLLYLLPPALMLWHGFGGTAGLIVVLPPVLVMAAGQLAGGLAWLTVSGEEAPDLVESAPIAPSQVIAAKVETVLLVVAVVFTPLLLAMALLAPLAACITALSAVVAAVSSTAIQFWFRVRAKRSQFRRRQTASRISTFAEAFSSIGWAATAAVMLALPVAGAITALLTAILLATVWKFSPASRKPA
jgi:ABC-2 type transport system permease protein